MSVAIGSQHEQFSATASKETSAILRLGGNEDLRASCVPCISEAVSLRSASPSPRSKVREEFDTEREMWRRTLRRLEDESAEVSSEIATAKAELGSVGDNAVADAVGVVDPAPSHRQVAQYTSMNSGAVTPTDSSALQSALWEQRAAVREVELMEAVVQERMKNAALQAAHAKSLEDRCSDMEALASREGRVCDRLTSELRSLESRSVMEQRRFNQERVVRDLHMQVAEAAATNAEMEAADFRDLAAVEEEEVSAAFAAKLRRLRVRSAQSAVAVEASGLEADLMCRFPGSGMKRPSGYGAVRSDWRISAGLAGVAPLALPSRSSASSADSSHQMRQAGGRMPKVGAPPEARRHGALSSRADSSSSFMTSASPAASSRQAADRSARTPTRTPPVDTAALVRKLQAELREQRLADAHRVAAAQEQAAQSLTSLRHELARRREMHEAEEAEIQLFVADAASKDEAVTVANAAAAAEACLCARLETELRGAAKIEVDELAAAEMRAAQELEWRRAVAMHHQTFESYSKELRAALLQAEEAAEAQFEPWQQQLNTAADQAVAARKRVVAAQDGSMAPRLQQQRAEAAEQEIAAAERACHNAIKDAAARHDEELRIERLQRDKAQYALAELRMALRRQHADAEAQHASALQEEERSERAMLDMRSEVSVGPLQRA
eukprot:TRINITY_DN29932_c0_g1_i1.p1 TRINITY_DN29932_c0_g1~~TRINITY_DN29932_c0_g1_i1.p1  ORF type:complete len:678 (-),score=176.63 TRINITY_DN29932_c0_g1_i1:45-2054(-)